MVFYTWIPGSTAPPPKVPRRLQSLPWNATDAVAGRLPVGASRPQRPPKSRTPQPGGVWAATSPAPCHRVPAMTHHDREALARSDAAPRAGFNDTASSDKMRALMARPCAKPTPIVRRNPPPLSSTAVSAATSPEPTESPDGGRHASPWASRPRRLRPVAATPAPGATTAADLDQARVELNTPAVKRHFHAGPRATAAAAAPAATADTPPAAADVPSVSPTQRSPAQQPAVPAASTAVPLPAVGSPSATRAATHSTPLQQPQQQPQQQPLPATVQRGWPTRHLPVSSGVPGATVRDLPRAVSQDLYFICGCRRPVGDVALCAHAQLHHRLRRWAQTLQDVVDAEATEWQRFSVAARDAAIARLQYEHDRRTAGAPLQFRTGSMSMGGAGGAGGGATRRRSSVAMPGALGAAASFSSGGLLTPGHGQPLDASNGAHSRGHSNAASRGVTPASGDRASVGSAHDAVASEASGTASSGPAGATAVGWAVN